MPTAREVEVAGEWFAWTVLHAVRARRALRTKYNPVDFFGGDVLAFLPTNHYALLQITKADQHAAEKRRGLERLGGKDPVRPLLSERRIYLEWDSVPDPEDGRRRIHVFHVQELRPRNTPDAGLERDEDEPPKRFMRDGRTRDGPFDGWTWYDWASPRVIDRDTWYAAGGLDAYRGG